MKCHGWQFPPEGARVALVTMARTCSLEGDLPPKAVGLVMEWGRAHKNDLLRDWDLARKKKSLFPIEPLE